MIKLSTLKHVAKLVVGVCLIYWLISSIDTAALMEKFASADVFYLMCSFILGLLLVVFQGVRQLALFKNIDIKMSPLVKLQYVATFIGNFLPATVGIDAYKAYFLKSYTKSLKNSGKLVIVDRLGGMATITIIGLFIFLVEPFNLQVESKFQFVNDYYFEVFSVFFLAAVISTCLIFYMLINRWSLAEAINLKLFLLSNLTVYAVQLGKFSFLGESAASNISLEIFGMMLLVVQFAALLPFTIGGLGIIEGSIVGVLVYLGVPVDSAAFIAIGNRLTILFSSTVGLFYWFKLKKETVV